MGLGETIEWPCPYCGGEHVFAEHVRKPDRHTVTICTTCHVIMDPHWIDGCWMGRWVEAGRPDTLARFVERRSYELRDNEGQEAGEGPSGRLPE